MRAPRDPAVPERTGILVIRVWVEPGQSGQLWARLTQAGDLGEPATTLAVATGAPAVRDAVERWLDQFAGAPER